MTYRCTYCDRETDLDYVVVLDEANEYLCVECDDQLREELDDFTNDH